MCEEQFGGAVDLLIDEQDVRTLLAPKELVREVISDRIYIHGEATDGAWRTVFEADVGVVMRWSEEDVLPDLSEDFFGQPQKGRLLD